jgi:2-keto-4-pentenoate hydratase/2-oxohepta-3-ene-1,7-dioic acid hydratase in catechol pathway
MYCNYRTAGRTRVGWWDGRAMRRVPGVVDTDELVRRGLPAVFPAGMELETEPFEFLPAVLRPSKVLCLLRSYRAHAAEQGHEPPPAPNFFAKLPSALVAHGADVVVPYDVEGEVHHEGELAVVIGRRGRRVREEEASDLIAGFTVADDVTARGVQKSDAARGWPWVRSKSPDTFLPLGPGLVPRAAAGDPQALDVIVRVNGATRQRGNTRDLLWPLGAILAHLSRWITLEAGDVVLTGTPEGVGPLLPGDRVEVEIPGVGLLAHGVRSETAPG